MALTKDDLQAIGTEIEKRVRPLMKAEIGVVREALQATEQRLSKAIREQAEHITKSIMEAVKLLAEDKATHMRLDELETEVEDLKQKVNSLLRHQ
jgi:phage shock protein A